MAVDNTSFLVLEESLAKRLDNAWGRVAAPVIKKIINAVKKKDFNTAYDLVNDLDLSGVVKRNKKYMDFVGVSATLYGASRIKPVNETSFKGKGKPVEVTKGGETTAMMLTENATTALRKKAYALINLEENRQKDSAIQKASEYTPFSKAFATSIRKEGQSYITLASSLHTSRLASWGFTVEAGLTGIEYYQVNEVLDGRTCPVCNEMHGKTFSVATAKNKLESWLNVQNPDDLRALATWPKQTKEGLLKLRGMSNVEIAGAGWDTPPYHPLCRGILTPAGKVPSIEELEMIPDILPPIDTITPLIKTPRPKPPAAIAAALLGSVETDLAADLVSETPKT